MIAGDTKLNHPKNNMCIANLNCGLQKKQAQFLVKSMRTNSSIEN